MRSKSMKEIRSLDKSMRDKVKGFPLFKVNFVKIRDDEDLQELVLSWYTWLLDSKEFKDLVKLYNENPLDWWMRVQKNFSYLPEYGLLKYRKQLFVELARKTMPQEIVHHDKRHANS